MLEHWIAVGWLKPHRTEDGFFFDETDIARTHLLCDLCYDMELRDEELTMVLSLVDQLNSARALLRAMTKAVHSQPDEVRESHFYDDPRASRAAGVRGRSLLQG